MSPAAVELPEEFEHLGGGNGSWLGRSVLAFSDSIRRDLRARLRDARDGREGE